VGEPLPAERALLTAQALPERVAEFARGRQAARMALTALGVLGADTFAVLREGRRAPQWPEGVVGAISHSGDWAGAAAAWRRDYLGIGLDLERIRTVKPQLVARIALPLERDWLNALPESRRSLGFALLFSAKESIYKALHPATGVFLGYGDAVVTASPPGTATSPPRPPHPPGPPLHKVERGEKDRLTPSALRAATPLLGERGEKDLAPRPPLRLGEGEAGSFRWTLLRASGELFPAGYEGEGRWRDLGEVVATAIWVRA
jgi:4'-phosphopantetheinyl transferase EntD